MTTDSQPDRGRASVHRTARPHAHTMPPRCPICGGRLTCPDRPPWVATLCILSPLLLPAALLIYAVIFAHC